MMFELKDNKIYRINFGLPRSPRVISNANMTKALALEFLRVNTEARKALFSKLPEDIDSMLKPKTRKNK